MKAQRKKTIAIYARKSRKSINSVSIENQLELGQDFAKKHSMQAMLFNDLNYSGKTADRPGLKKMMEAINNDLVDEVFIYDTSRLFRNQLNMLQTLQVLQEKKIQLYIYKNGKYFDPLSSSEKIAFGFDLIMAESLLDEVSHKIKSAIEYNTDKLSKGHGLLPYGYKYNTEKKITIDTQEEHIVKIIYDLYTIDKLGIYQIKNFLNKNNFKTRSADKYDGVDFYVYNKPKDLVYKKGRNEVIWSETQVRNILKNSIYKGEWKFKNKFYAVPNIVDPHQWENAQAFLVENKRTRKVITKNEFLLRGKISCGKCGRNYFGYKKVKSGDNVYKCSSKRIDTTQCDNIGVNIDLIENIIWALLFAQKDTINYIKDRLVQSDNSLNLLKDDLSDLNTEMKLLEKNIKTTNEVLTTKVLDGEMMVEMVSTLRRLKGIKKEKDSKIELLKRKIATKEEYNSRTINVDEIHNNLLHLEEIDFDKRVKLVDDLIEEIYVDWRYRAIYNSKKDDTLRKTIMVKIQFRNLVELDNLEFELVRVSNKDHLLIYDYLNKEMQTPLSKDYDLTYYVSTVKSMLKIKKILPQH